MSGSRIPRFARLGSLLALGAFGVHQARYLLAFGPDSGEQLSHQGHDYLAGAVPFLAGLALAVLIATVLGARPGSRLARATQPRRALSYAVAMLAIYCCQELIEGTLAPGHPAGPDALLAAAGWTALPLALLFGGLVALAMRALEGIEAALAAPARESARRLPPRTKGVPLTGRSPSRLLSPLAFGLARRPIRLAARRGTL
jgi:hypothetical protein